MKTFKSDCMRFDGEHLWLLDQTLLPQRETWLQASSVKSLVSMIQRLAIRGAPAIGIAASLLLAHLAERGMRAEALMQAADTLQAARPTAVNVVNNLEQMKAVIESGAPTCQIVAQAEHLLDQDIEQCAQIARNGAALIQAREKILTHCNTGGLATPGAGTALGVITEACKRHQNLFVWVDETRPLLQGGRLTAWECLRRNIPHKIICDNMAAMLMARGEVDRVLVGADRIATNGDFANKVGTYSLAVLAHHHRVPLYVVAPQTTVDRHCPSGQSIPIEHRDQSEVHGASGGFGECTWAPQASPAYNPAFDVTPAELVSAWVLDSGVFSQPDLRAQNWWCPQSRV